MSASIWDICKLRVQSIIRAFRRPKPRKKDQNDTQEINKLKNKAANLEATEATHRELRSKAQWIEKELGVWERGDFGSIE
ncbi:hypothetical protein F8M41_000639 [Gigaspora margarita]|uniref:Uncharacterized protein n=1 Tax=Gigaspora margarita TaxID=4874 RepID=A0A8H3XI81_GIGMA|nr:hypothetical protein F8M41_000639 [Gigaspora margarita]